MRTTKQLAWARHNHYTSTYSFLHSNNVSSQNLKHADSEKASVGGSSPPRRAALSSAQGIVRIGLCVDFVGLRVSRHHRPRSLALQLFCPCPGTDGSCCPIPRGCLTSALHQKLDASKEGTPCQQ